MDTATFIGLVAAALSSLSMAPQVIKIFKTKKTHDLSLGAFSVLASGLFLWFVYGILIGELPVIAGNALGLSMVVYIIIMKLRHG
ncbi:MAG: SemiSWEET transporter [Syntrophales bacterium]|jgi:MtN3 and saliva related transmembrane protein|nr:SemiSWEET transporter [Syntrophales bacterium]MDY0044377.1 SemiSWEET transporter [Syntrophales bacterium]